MVLATALFICGLNASAKAATTTYLGKWTDNGIEHHYLAYSDPDSTESFDSTTYSNLMYWENARDLATTIELDVNGETLADGGHLATFTSSDENFTVWDEVARKGLTGLSFWLGGYQDRIGATATDPGSKSGNQLNWHWVTGETWNVDDALWATAEPNDSRWAQERHPDTDIMYTQDERYLHWFTGHADGYWNDQSSFSTNGAGSAVSCQTYSFIVEYELPGKSQPVPVPSTIFLLGTGLAGLAGKISRRKKNAISC